MDNNTALFHILETLIHQLFANIKSYRLVIQQNKFLISLHQGDQAVLKGFGRADPSVIDLVQKIAVRRFFDNKLLDETSELEHLAPVKKRRLVVPQLVDLIIQRLSVGGRAVVQVCAGPDPDLLVLDLLGRILNKRGVSISLIRGMIDNAIRAARKSTDTMLHNIVNFFRLVPLLQLDDDNIAAVVLVSACDHKIHALGSSGDLVLDRDIGVAGNLRIVDHRSHKMQRILPGMKLRCLPA